MTAVRNILIVGGGSAGWLAAAYLARTLGAGDPAGRLNQRDARPGIPTIGVGEGSFPSLRGTLASIGIAEDRFIREANATFKQGIRFDHWVRPPGTPGTDHYFHPFSQPSQRPGGPELLPYWLLGEAGGAPFADAATLQKRVADASRGPKRLTDADYLGALNYAYHFDAGRFAALLADEARALGVTHVAATVERVDIGDSGLISAVHTREAGALTADLYLDCTGFHAALIGGALQSPFRSLANSLFVDRALAIQAPYPRADAPIASYTISTAQTAGWIWDIGLQQRRGIGHVYSSHHIDDEQAERELRAYIGPAAEGLSARRLDLRIGYRETQWIGNCVAVGLSSGFIEPLEASGLGLVEAATYLIAHLFPHDGQFDAAARQLNAHMRTRYERIADFVKLHYALSQRPEPFWRDNADAATRSSLLGEQLAMWRTRAPHRLDFITDLEMYPPSSWQYVLYGMEYATALTPNARAWPRGTEARQEFAMLKQLAPRATSDLPAHRALVEHLCARG
jgi:tryptophan halogenase